MKVLNSLKVNSNICMSNKNAQAQSGTSGTKSKDLLVPIVSPAYYSPSFLSGYDYEDDGILCPKDPSQEYTFKVLRYDSEMNNPDYIFSGEERDEWLDFYLAKTGLLDEKLSNVYRLPWTKNSYRGQSFRYMDDKTYGNMVEAGIKTIIDFSRSSDVSQGLTEKHGIVYISFPVHNIINPVHPLNLGEEGTPRCRVDKLTDYISAMRKDNVYVCCLYGQNDTSQGLLINNWFNPDRKLEGACGNYTLLDYVSDMYENLTEEDKAKMGRNEDFEENFLKKLDEESLTIHRTFETDYNPTDS